jgi:transglutaminase/protease-like cytokinesis protein 3
VIGKIPKAIERDIDKVAKFIALHEKRPFHRIKALHDFVTDRVAYDVPALSMARIPPQNADKVLREGKGVCAGYAKLMTALGRAIGENIVYVVGVSRDMGGSVGGAGHAWNAAQIEGRWYLIDATWNAGYVNGDTFTKRYTTNYLFTPPEYFGINHLPDKDAWQLRKAPMSRGEFIRQPMLRPAFFRHGLKLLEPKRSQVTVGDHAQLRIANPNRFFLSANLHEKRGSTTRPSGERCRVSNGGSELRVDCAMPGSGTYQVWMFANPKQMGSYEFVGQLEVNSR